MDNLAPIKTEGMSSAYANPEIGEWPSCRPEYYEYIHQRYGAWYFAPVRKFLCREAAFTWDLALFSNAYVAHHGP